MRPETKIFRNEEILSSEYLPELLPHREQQIKQLANNLLPACNGKKPQNTFIFGPPGIGKTAVAKFVFRQFEDYSGVKTIYVNCWDYKTPVALLSKIAIDLGYPVQRRGWAKDEIITKLTEYLNKTKKGLIVCLDEVDQLQQEALYDLLRINQYVGNPVGLVFISNDPHIFAFTEPRIISSLAIDEIEFKTYTLEEMKDILQERIKYAFHTVETGVVSLCANHAVSKGGDVRIGLQCLFKAGRLAEQENATKLKVEHVKKVLKEIKPVKPKILEEKVSETEKIILQLMKSRIVEQVGELYKRYCKTVENPVSDRRFRSLLNNLAKLNLIKIRKKKIRGSIRLVSKV